jgi:hypothetical protein
MTRLRALGAALACVAATVAYAQNASAPAASAPVSPAKKQLVARVIQLQQPQIELIGRALVEQPARALLQQASIVLQQRVAPERRQAIGEDIQSDARKYADEALPLVRERALQLAPSTLGPLLEQRMTEDELRQTIAFLESPVLKKYQSLFPEMQHSLGERLVAEMRPTIDPKVRALEQSIAQRLGVGNAASAPASGRTEPTPAAAPGK